MQQRKIGSVYTQQSLTLSLVDAQLQVVMEGTRTEVDLLVRQLEMSEACKDVSASAADKPTRQTEVPHHHHREHSLDSQRR